MFCPWFISVISTDFPADTEMISFLVLSHTGTYGKKFCLKNDPCPLSVFNFHKQVCATGSANGWRLLKLLSNTFASFTSCLDLDLYHLVLCRQLLVDLDWGFSFRVNMKFLWSCFGLVSVWLFSLLARWLLYLQFWSDWVFSRILSCILRVLLSTRKSCFRNSYFPSALSVL